jgi:alkanesulfonate monooxygenase SsuD/methylene tetrahydromethanopterin reductase-like flavin-dependent oxidoreductase (luciferase family)
VDIGIGLPSTVPGTTGEDLLEFARRADAAGFSTLGTIDRIVYPNYEPLIALAGAAAVTERIRLATTILIVPYRANMALLAKQAASVDALSGGRLWLGVAVGGREDDYDVSGVDFSTRGRVFESQIERIKEIWAGDEIGPRPAQGGGPPLVFGGAVDKTYERAAQYGAGWAMGGGTPEMFADGAEQMRAAWKRHGREGEPVLKALGYYALGPDAQEDAERSLGDYYAWLGPYASAIVDGAAKDAEAVRTTVEAFEQVGCQELFLFPSSGDPRQVDLLAEAALA